MLAAQRLFELVVVLLLSRSYKRLLVDGPIRRSPGDQPGMVLRDVACGQGFRCGLQRSQPFRSLDIVAGGPLGGLQFLSDDPLGSDRVVLAGHLGHRLGLHRRQFRLGPPDQADSRPQ